MAALQMREDTATGRLTLVAPLTSRVGGMAFGLVWVVFLGAFFLLPMLTSESVDWTNLLFVLVVLAFSGGSSLISSLTTTTVTLDRGNRTLTSVSSLLVFPLRSATVSFADLANLEVQYYRHSAGRASHDAWRVNALDKSGKRIPLNWDGKQSEMAELAQKMVALTGAPLLDNSAKPESAMRRMFEKRMPPATTDQPTQDSDYTNGNQTSQPQADQPTASQPMIPTTTEPGLPPVADTSTMPSYPTFAEPASTPDPSNLSISELEKRFQEDAMDSDARYALARKYHARGQFDRALALYQETMRLDPSNGGVQNDLGVALQQRGKRTEAEAAYRRAIALDPFSSTAHLNLGLLLSGMKRAADASQEFFLARQNANGDDEMRAAEAASTGVKIEPQLSK